ncbi:MAG TPA: hypothetical protein VIY86_15315, partial [Pirellulaceae bacterium]
DDDSGKYMRRVFTSTAPVEDNRGLTFYITLVFRDAGTTISGNQMTIVITPTASTCRSLQEQAKKNASDEEGPMDLPICDPDAELLFAQ